MENAPNGNVFCFFGKEIKINCKKIKENRYKFKVRCYLGHLPPIYGKCTR